MPVTINGDGSITGLSVGGLGSGVVNTATIADGAVDADALASNAVTSAKLASGSVTSSAMQVGSILQVQYYLETRRSQNCTSTSWAATGFGGAITTKSANSKILLTFVGGGWYDNGSGSSHMNITFDRRFDGGSYSFPSNANDGYNGLLRMSGDGNSWNIKPYACALADSPAQAAGTVIDYRVMMKLSQNPTTQYQSTDRGLPSLTIMGIKV